MGELLPRGPGSPSTDPPNPRNTRYKGQRPSLLREDRVQSEGTEIASTHKIELPLFVRP